MPRDFAKKIESHRKPRYSKKKHSDFQTAIGAKLNWYAAGIASGAILSFFVYLFSLPTNQNHKEKTISKIETTVGRTSNNQAEPEFAFYEILPEDSSNIDKANSNALGNEISANNTIYFLQAGAFRQKKDADTRRAQLTLLDLDSKISSTQKEQGGYHRVSIGPFESINQTKKIQKLLEEEGIQSIIKKRELH